MARNREQESEDEQWLSEIRNTPAETDFGAASRPASLAPDPWLDAPNPGHPSSPPHEPVTSRDEPQDRALPQDDPWAPKPSAAPTPMPQADLSGASSSPMPTYQPQTPPAPMPTYQPTQPSSPPSPGDSPRPEAPQAEDAGAVDEPQPDEFTAAPDPFGQPSTQTAASAPPAETPGSDAPESDQAQPPVSEPEPAAFDDARPVDQAPPPWSPPPQDVVSQGGAHAAPQQGEQQSFPPTGAHAAPPQHEQQPFGQTGSQPAQPHTGSQPAASGWAAPSGSAGQFTGASAYAGQEQGASPQPYAPTHSESAAPAQTESAAYSPAQFGQQAPSQSAYPTPQAGAPEGYGQQGAGQYAPPGGGQYQQPGAPYQAGGMPQQPSAPPAINQHSLVRERKAAPQSGWRRAVFKASFGGINPGLSKEEQERDALVSRIRTPIRGSHKIAVVSLKGGIGKTTTTSCLGLTLAHYRGDRVVALDANPDAGTLAERLTGVTDVSVRNLLDDLDQINSFTDISRYMSLANRLQVLASDQDAEVSEAFDAAQYTKVTDLLARYYNVILTDSGTGMLHSAMQGTLEAANALVVVGAPSVDGSSRASKTLDWLIAHGYGDLVSQSVAVISSVREKTDNVDMDVLRNHFGARCRAVLEIPYDPHLVVGGQIEMGAISPATNRAYLELAAAVADGFTSPVQAARERAADRQ
ncbi:AAA family ATPase [Epidermidibacterium keratini]|uniref:AAA family ATPase n=1 Tax=Epidermidibacterium keratini TaxID=1891644 RepID=A0A7L4YN46_9ACTN|nr:MinD/ParA family protein [Epidermidibacterium keratini]QHC00239.1 AAA family ATPase [Epidermidibacterium keratini]